jgi:hypothetical protein
MNVDAGALNRPASAGDWDYDDVNSQCLYDNGLEKTSPSKSVPSTKPCSQKGGKGSRPTTTGSATTVTTAEGTGSLAGPAVTVVKQRTKMPRITAEQVAAYKATYLQEELEFQKRRHCPTTSTCTGTGTVPQEEGLRPPCLEIVFTTKPKPTTLPKNPPRHLAGKSSTSTSTSTSTSAANHGHNKSRDQQQHGEGQSTKTSLRLAKELGRLNGTLDMKDMDIQDRRFVTTPEGEVVEVIRVKPSKAPRPSRHFSLQSLRKYLAPRNHNSNHKSNHLQVIDLRNGSTIPEFLTKDIMTSGLDGHHEEPVTRLQQQHQDESESKGSF